MNQGFSHLNDFNPAIQTLPARVKGIDGEFFKSFEIIPFFPQPNGERCSLHPRLGELPRNADSVSSWPFIRPEEIIITAGLWARRTLIFKKITNAISLAVLCLEVRRYLDPLDTVLCWVRLKSSFDEFWRGPEDPPQKIRILNNDNNVIVNLWIDMCQHEDGDWGK